MAVSATLKKVILGLFWQMVHVLEHFFDFDNDGNLDTDDLKIAFEKFLEVLPMVASTTANWKTMDIGAKISAVIKVAMAQLPDKFAGMKDWIVALLEVFAHINLKLDAEK